MTTASTKDATPNVPAQVFEKFLRALGEASVSAELVARLRKTLLEERTFTERALQVAVFGEEALK